MMYMRQQCRISNQRNKSLEFLSDDLVRWMMVSEVAEEETAEHLQFEHGVGVLAVPVGAVEEDGVEADGHGWVRRGCGVVRGW